ncbi:MAG: ABC transporter ATP-binding protein [Firmicutes bacterium HGW-Firmicutes-14]|nr:MAG: ABC transporter ATP-binding protein [Firmicutes bacterium HGW-Firmicutes-14]
MVLEARGLTKRFGGLVAVSDVSLTINQGEFVGLIGPNGAGKTTLFNLLTGFHRPSAGTVVFKGEDITGLKTSGRVHLGLARTFQIVQPFPELTVSEHVQVGLLTNKRKKQINVQQEIEEILNAVGLVEKSNDLAKHLSLGQLKRLEIARAMATGPSMILLDEPFGGLGQHEIAAIQELITDLQHKGVTILIIEHVLKAIMNLCQRVIVLNEGRILAQGTPEEIINNPEVVGAYLGKTDSGQLKKVL